MFLTLLSYFMPASITRFIKFSVHFNLDVKVSLQVGQTQDETLSGAGSGLSVNIFHKYYIYKISIF